MPKKKPDVAGEKVDLSIESQLHQVKPRDKFGSITGKRFEYQYQQTAKACLVLLEDNENLCVFCEWHDDFVVEKKPQFNARAIYAFNQVKTKEGGTGPWDLKSLFGVNSKKATPLKTIQKSHIFKLLRHFVDFGSRVESIVFITNAALDPDLSNFINDVNSNEVSLKLNVKNQAIFQKLFNEYSQLLIDVNAVDFYVMLKKLFVIPEDTPLLRTSSVFHTELADMIFKFSEIDLKRSEALRIGQELTELVRTKAIYCLETTTTTDKLKKFKGIVIEDVLPLLSLSYSSYQKLKNGGHLDALKQLSRLRKLLVDSEPNISQSAIEAFCEIKVDWNNWLRNVRHNPHSKTNLISLQTAAEQLLNDWVKNKISMNEVSLRAQNIAFDQKGKFPEEPELTADLIFGCLLSIAVEKT